MTDCPRCGTPNAPDARFCNSCGNSLVTRVGVQERRVVTALFADLARSTSMGEQLDPEVVRGMVGRFFELATAQIESRGGTVEKFSGDAVMAVFGLPQAHEDDPERAVRAAIAIRDGVAAIAADTQERHGIALQARIGIESGEVVVGDPFGGATMATGDAMNVAARLEQQAEPGEIVVGPFVWEQVHDLVAAEAMGELALKGRDQKLRGWRVTDVASDVGRPRGVPGLEAPLTGRDGELNLMLEAARRAQDERKATLFTILGVPGVGKSRLTREATSRLANDGWSIVKGRCLPYGEGITYWPVAEMLRNLAGFQPDISPEDAQAALLAISPEAEVATALGTALGSREGSQVATSSSDTEVAWAFRRLIEHLAVSIPQVLVFEDIHWAEPALLDLIEYLVTWTRDAPVLVICPSRPELFDTRPAWGAGRMESARIQLEPLSEAESRSMLSAMLTVDDLPAALRQQVLDRAEGNPLFVEEVVRLLIAEGVVEQRGGRWHASKEAAHVRVPDSVEALIRARLDTIPASERLMLQTASVVGRIFQKSAVVAISAPAESGGLQKHLDDAVLRDLITEEHSLDRDPTFRFRHILIRDVAYNTLPKARRAELHREVATWLRAWAGSRMDEFVEIEAYHLEQAVALRRELDGRADPADAQRAVTALATSADKAMARQDQTTALGFVERALALDPASGEQRLELNWRVVECLRRLGEFRRCLLLAVEVERDAVALGRADIQGRAMLARAHATWLGRDTADLKTARIVLEQARDLLVTAGDDWYLGTVLGVMAYSTFAEGDLRGSEGIRAQYTELARSNGWLDREAIGLVQRARIRRELGDVEVARRLISDALAVAERGASRFARTAAELQGVVLRLFTTADSDPEPVLQAAAKEFEESGDRDGLHSALNWLGVLEIWRDRPAEALTYFRRAIAPTEEHAGNWPEAQRFVAQTLVELGEIDEAGRIAEAAYEQTAPEDFATIASLSMVLGLVREAEGQFDEAERLLNKAMTVYVSGEYNPWEYELSLAEFMLRRGRTEEGNKWLAKALASVSRYGTGSPLIGFVERRRARAAQVGASESA